MQIVWRTLPKLALPAAIGLGVAYLATSFVPRPAPSLRPPEELRAQGQAYGEESPVRIILERNVLKLESTPFYPLGQPPAPIAPPEAAVPPPAPAPARAAFAQADTSVAPQGSTQQGSVPLGSGSPAASPLAPGPQVSASLSGGASVQGLAVRPAQGNSPAAAPATAPATAPGLGGPVQPLPQAPPAHQAVPPAAKAPAGDPKALSGNTKIPAADAKALAGDAKALAGDAKAPAADTRAPAGQAGPRLGLEGFRLLGVIAGGERPLAMLQVDGAGVTLRLGEQARGWTLVAVEVGQVLLQNGEQQRRLVLGGAGPAQRAKP